MSWIVLRDLCREANLSFRALSPCMLFAQSVAGAAASPLPREEGSAMAWPHGVLQWNKEGASDLVNVELGA